MCLCLSEYFDKISLCSRNLICVPLIPGSDSYSVINGGLSMPIRAQCVILFNHTEKNKCGNVEFALKSDWPNPFVFPNVGKHVSWSFRQVVYYVWYIVTLKCIAIK